MVICVIRSFYGGFNTLDEQLKVDAMIIPLEMVQFVFWWTNWSGEPSRYKRCFAPAKIALGRPCNFSHKFYSSLLPSLKGKVLYKGCHIFQCGGEESEIQIYLENNSALFDSYPQKNTWPNPWIKLPQCQQSPCYFPTPIYLFPCRRSHGSCAEELSQGG